jgi:hypothetical protein
VTFKDPDRSNQEVPASEGAVLGSCAAVTVPPKTEEDWAEAIRLDLVAGTASYINAGRKFLQAKQALKRTNGSFIHLVTDLLGYDLDTAERWMEIARHPVLSDSANSRILPTAWTTLYTLSRIPPKLLQKHVVDGTVHARLSGKAATQLLKRGANGGRDPNGGGDTGRDHDEHRDGDAGRDGVHGDDRGHGSDRSYDHRHTGDAAGNSPAADDAIGPDSPGEIARKLARLEELERETRRHAIQLSGYESEVVELKAKLGPEPPIRAQRKLFQQALRALQKSEVAGTLEKERRFLKQSATTDLIELVRSAVRDGLKPERLDLVYRPEMH